MRVGFVVVVHEIQAIALNGVGKRGVGGGNLISVSYTHLPGQAVEGVPDILAVFQLFFF